jgi:hypothetical protein
MMINGETNDRIERRFDDRSKSPLEFIATLGDWSADTPICASNDASIETKGIKLQRIMLENKATIAGRDQLHVWGENYAASSHFISREGTLLCKHYLIMYFYNPVLLCSITFRNK